MDTTNIRDRDNDGIPDAEQLTIDEIDLVDRHFGESLIDISRNPARRAPKVGRQNDKDFDPDELEYVATLRIPLYRSKTTGKRYTLNHTRLVDERVVELREGHSSEGGVMGGRAAAFSSLALAKLGTFGSFVGAVLSAGGSVPAILVNAAAGLLRKNVTGKTGSAILDAIFGAKAA